MADRYWVNGTGNWTDTGKWSASSGGPSGASVPTSADNVFFDNASASGTFTVTVNTTTAFCLNFDASGITDPAKKMTLAAGTTANINVAGSWTNPSSTFYACSYAGTLTFSSTTTGKTITTNGVIMMISAGNSLTFDGVGGEWTLGGALTVSNNINSNVVFTNGSINLNNFTLTVGYFGSNNSNVRSIKFGTSGSINTFNNLGGVTLFNMPTITNFSFTGTSSIIISATAPTGQSLVRYGSTAGGTEALSLNFTITGTGIINLQGSFIRNLTFSSYTSNPIIRANIYGNLVLSSGMLVGPDTVNTNFSTTTSQNITTNGITFDAPVTFNGTGTYTLVDNFTVGSSRLLTFTSGTLNINSNSVSSGTFTSTGATARTLAFGTGGTFVLAGSGATAWNATGSGLTTSGTGTISMTSASAKTFVGGGYNYAAALNQGGAGTLTISGSNTFQNITNTYGATGATTITFTAGTTQTVSAFTASGTSGKILTLNSSSAGTRFNLSDLTGLVSVSFCDIKDSNATGGARWLSYLANGNVNSGNNLGWRFSQGEGLNVISGLSGTRGLSIGVGLVGNL